MITAKIGAQNYTTAIQAREHAYKADEPLDLGGLNQGPTPTDFLNSALASCMLITLRMYINRKEWQVNAIEADIERTTNEADKSSIFEVELRVSGELDEKQLARIEKIAHLCPIHKVLERGNEIRINLTKV
jgi:putative redox protein